MLGHMGVMECTQRRLLKISRSLFLRAPVMSPGNEPCLRATLSAAVGKLTHD